MIISSEFAYFLLFYVVVILYAVLCAFHIEQL